MYYTVATKMVVVSGTPSYTQAVPMDGMNAAQVDLTNFASGTGTATLQEGNDLENWVDLLSGSGTGTIPATNYQGAIKGTAIASKFVRLKLVVSATAIIGAGINTAPL